MSKPAETALIVAAVLILSLLAAWLFGENGSGPAIERPAEPQLAPAMPAPRSVKRLTAPKPAPARPQAPDTTERGLAWLAKAQHSEGHWDRSPHRTGLALLAFLSAGETHKHGKYKRTVKNGLRVLKQIQHPDGIYKMAKSPGSNLDHAIATLAMVEAYATTASPLFKQSAQQAVNAIPPLRELDKYAVQWAGIVLHSAIKAGLRVRLPDPAGIDLSRFGKWRPYSMKDPNSHFNGCWYAASIDPDLDPNWRWDFRDVAARLQQADGSFAPTGRHRDFLGRVGTTALMTAATAMTFWAEPAGRK